MKLLIEIKSNKPLSEYGDNHVIVYDKNTNSYYVTTAESFFAGQNVKIKEIKQKVDEIRTENNNMHQEMIDFENAMQAKMNDFLSQYQTTNAKLLAMVKELVKNKEE